VFPDALDGWSSGGVEFVIGDCFEPHRLICERFLSLPHGRTQLATLVDCSWLGGSPSCVGCAAPAEGLALECQLARDPSSGCIATTSTSLTGNK
jgi:hypothetical protein